MRRIIINVTTLLVAIACGMAQTTVAPSSYDLAAVIARVQAANPTLHAARQAVTTAQAKVAEARAGRRPRVQGEAGYMQLARDPSFTVSPMGTLVFGQADNPSANISLDWPIYSSGLVDGMITASRRGVDAAWQGYTRSRQEILAEASTAYYQVLSAQRMVEVMQAQITTLKEAVRVATSLHDQGVVAKLDVLRPTSELASAQTSLTQAENGTQLALANIKRLLNLPIDTVITLTPTADMPLPTALDLPPTIQLALAQRPEVQQLQAYLAASAAQRTIARAGRKASLGLHAQYDVKRQTTYPDSGSWLVAIVVRQPIYDGGTAKAQLAAVDSQRDELLDQQEALRQGISMQVTSAVLNMQSADKSLESATLAAVTAEEAFRDAEISYKNQVVPMLDVLSAQNALTNARVQLALAQFNRQIALVQYHLALGDTLKSAMEVRESDTPAGRIKEKGK